MSILLIIYNADNSIHIDDFRTLMKREFHGGEKIEKRFIRDNKRMEK